MPRRRTHHYRTRSVAVRAMPLASYSHETLQAPKPSVSADASHTTSTERATALPESVTPEIVRRERGYLVPVVTLCAVDCGYKHTHIQDCGARAHGGGSREHAQGMHACLFMFYRFSMQAQVTLQSAPSAVLADEAKFARKLKQRLVKVCPQEESCSLISDDCLDRSFERLLKSTLSPSLR